MSTYGLIFSHIKYLGSLSPLTLYTDFQFFFFFFFFFFFYYLSGWSSLRFFFFKLNFVKFVYSSIRQLYCCDITDCNRVPSDRAANKKFIRTLKNHSSWLDYPNLLELLLLGSKIIFHSLNLHKYMSKLFLSRRQYVPDLVESFWGGLDK